MIRILILLGVVVALAAAALLAKAAVRKPKKAAKGEKGEILKQLLALSELENGVSPNKRTRPRNLPRTPAARTRNETGRKDSRPAVSSVRPVPIRANLTDKELEAQIRQRAHELYQKRGGVGGSATDDWLRAKEEVLRQKTRAAKTSS